MHNKICSLGLDENSENINKIFPDMNKLNYEEMDLEELELFRKSFEERYDLVVSRIYREKRKKEAERRKEYEENFELREGFIRSDLKYIYENKGQRAGDTVRNQIDELRKKFSDGSDKAKRAFYHHAERIIRAKYKNET